MWRIQVVEHLRQYTMKKARHKVCFLLSVKMYLQLVTFLTGLLRVFVADKEFTCSTEFWLNIELLTNDDSTKNSALPEVSEGVESIPGPGQSDTDPVVRLQKAH